MGWYILITIVALIIQVALSTKFAECADDKGYSKNAYFALCLLLGFPGYCLVAALPDLNLRYQIANHSTSTFIKKAPNPLKENTTSYATAHATITANGTWICGNCKTENNINYGQCKKCGKYRT